MLQRHKRRMLIDEIRTRTAPLGQMSLLESMDKFQDVLEKAEKAIVCVTFTAKWCGPWKMVKPGNSLVTRSRIDNSSGDPPLIIVVLIVVVSNYLYFGQQCQCLISHFEL